MTPQKQNSKRSNRVFADHSIYEIYVGKTIGNWRSFNIWFLSASCYFSNCSVIRNQQHFQQFLNTFHIPIQRHVNGNWAHQGIAKYSSPYIQFKFLNLLTLFIFYGCNLYSFVTALADEQESPPTYVSVRNQTYAFLLGLPFVKQLLSHEHGCAQHRK